MMNLQYILIKFLHHGIIQVHPTKSSLSIISSRCDLIQQSIPDCGAVIQNVINIPEGVTISCGLPDASRERFSKDLVDDEQNSPHKKYEGLYYGY